MFAKNPPSSISEQDVLNALRGVKDPDLGRDLTDLGMIKDIRIEGKRLSLSVNLTTPACPLKAKIEKDVRDALAARLPALESVQIQMTSTVRGKPMMEKGDLPGVKNVIAVGSGKGGVGKSTIAAAIAFGFQTYGARVGLMDADVYGPSIPHLLGASARPAIANNKIQPVEAGGLKLMSAGFVAEPGKAMIVRGPILHQLMSQFLHDVQWGELDYLVIDLPPTTGDVPLSLSQLLPLTGGVIVCTPQDVALIDARRALNMYRTLKVPILGIVENMSHFDCPNCHHRTDIFGTGGARRMAEQEGVPFLGEIPLNLMIRVRGDAGQIKDVYAEESPVRSCLLAMCEQLAAQISVRNLKYPKMPTLEIIQ